jgi:hypothetical protein
MSGRPHVIKVVHLIYGLRGAFTSMRACTKATYLGASWPSAGSFWFANWPPDLERVSRQKFDLVSPKGLVQRGHSHDVGPSVDSSRRVSIDIQSDAGSARAWLQTYVGPSAPIGPAFVVSGPRHMGRRFAPAERIPLRIY